MLGVTISANLKWNEHVSDLCKRGFVKIWMLRRLKKIGATKEILLDLYYKHIRSILEYAAPVWHPGLSNHNKIDLERVQKCSFSVIFGELSYTSILQKYKLETLDKRRDNLCFKFASKTVKHPVFAEWFCRKEKVVNTRSTSLFHVPQCNTSRWKNSPIPYMTQLLNMQRS